MALTSDQGEYFVNSINSAKLCQDPPRLRPQPFSNQRNLSRSKKTRIAANRITSSFSNIYFSDENVVKG